MGKSAKKRRRREQQRLARQRSEAESKQQKNPGADLLLSSPATANNSTLAQKIVSSQSSDKNTSSKAPSSQSLDSNGRDRRSHKSASTKEDDIRRESPAAKPLFSLVGEVAGTESRKRSRRQLDFVYPRKNGSAVPYIFDKHCKESNQNNGKDQSSVALVAAAEEKHQRPSTSESIDEILFSSKGKNHQRASQNNHDNNVGVTERELGMEGKLSGTSVEEAVRDESGCRPRANSTDGELNLPRRGLCDEHMVLQAHKWDPNGQKFRSSPKGFVNLGNTCFLNSTLQCLAYLPPFCQSLMAMPERVASQNGRKASHGKKITLTLRALFQKVHGRDAENHGGAIAPRSIVQAVPSLGTCGSRKGYKFRPGRQEDAHEFLVHLLDAMHDGELREAGIDQRVSGWRDRLPVPRLDETTFVNRVFGGYLRSQVRCTKCGYCSNTYDPFLDLALEVSKQSITSVAAAFQEFTRKETLDSENRWKCSGCNKRVCATKQLTVFRPPLSLCVQMKRFTFGGMGSFGSRGFHSKSFKGRGHGNKVSKPIAFPSEMKLPLSDGRSCEYALTGMVIHVGGSADSGHYTAYVKKAGAEGSDRWYHMDDSFVEAVSEKTVLRQRDAYLLFYCRKEVKLEFPSPPLRAFMSAEAATEHGRARARARSDSWAILDKKSSTSNAVETDKKVPQDAPNPTTATTEVVVTGSHVSDSHNNLRDGDQNLPAPGDHNEKVQSGKPKDQRDASAESSPDSSSSESSDDDSGNSSSTESDVAKRPPANTSGKHTRDKDEHMTRGSDHAKADHNTPDQLSTTEKSQKSSASDDSDSSSNSDSESSSSSSLGDAATIPQESTLKLEEPAVPSLPASKDEGSRKVEPKAKKASALTRVVLDRGSGREKVSVMMGTRLKNKNAWNPQTTGTTKKGHEYELLGNRVVDKWDDNSDTAQSSEASKISEARSQIVSSMDKKSRAQKRKTYLDNWDASLDRGRTKKVKQKGTYDDTAGSSKSSFQHILTSLQKIKHGRPKGFVSEKHPGKHTKKRKHHH